MGNGKGEHVKMKHVKSKRSREKGIGNMISNVDEGRSAKETGKEEQNGESQKGKLKIDRMEGQVIMVWRTTMSNVYK